MKITKKFRLCIVLTSILVSLIIGFNQLKTLADSYDVTASVPFPVPSVAAKIDQSFSNSTKSADLLQIFGTCQSISPYSIVSIFRGSSLLGSVNCESNGTFRLNINLLEGANNLIARTSNISNVYGPDSDPVNINYVQPPQTSTNSNTSQNNETQSNTSSDLTISTPSPIEIINDNKEVSVDIVVSGGKNPYKLVIVWGDGTTDSKDIQEEGTYRFTHKYQKEGIYKALARVTDFFGITKTYQFVLASHATNNVSKNSNPLSQSGTDKSTKDQNIFNKWIWPEVIFLQILLVLLAYWYGFRRRNKKVEELVQKRLSKNPKPTKKSNKK